MHGYCKLKCVTGKVVPVPANHSRKVYGGIVLHFSHFTTGIA
jgi:hypothetical protein